MREGGGHLKRETDCGLYLSQVKHAQQPCNAVSRPSDVSIRLYTSFLTMLRYLPTSVTKSENLISFGNIFEL